MEGIKILFTPGHSPGGQSVAVQTPEGVAIVSGLCSIFDNFDPPEQARAKGFPVVPPGLHSNPFQAFDSLVRIKQAADIVIPLHDASFLDKGL